MLDHHARLLECNGFIEYAQSEFPKLRNKEIGTTVARCSNCISSSLYARIEDGLCHLCKAYRASQAAGDERDDSGRKAEVAELHDLLESSGGRGEHLYDALVMFSGGKDSTYLIHTLRKEYPALRLLAVTVDSGFASTVGLENARAVARRLEGVDSTILRPKKDLFYRAFRYALTHPKDETCYRAIDLLDGELTFDIGRNLAASMKIPLFIAGTSTAQLRLLHNLDWFERPREIMLAKRTHTTGGYAITELTPEENLGYWWDGTRWPAEQVPRNILPFHAWDYDEGRIQAEVVRLGYLEAGSNNPLVTNNILIPLMVCIDYARFGYCGFEPEFALLVREERAQREFWANLFDAAAYLAANGDFLPRCVADALQHLDLSRRDVGLPDR